MSERDFDKELDDLKEIIKNVTGEEGIKRVNYVGRYFSSACESVNYSVIQNIIE